jgi:MFS family permease
LVVYFALIALQIIIVGGTTSSVIYARLIAEQFTRARGVALAIVGCAPAAAGALVVPFVSAFMDSHGWRAGYIAVAIGIAIFGAVVILLIPKRVVERGAVPRKSAVPRDEPAINFAAILRSRPFVLVIGGLILCNVFFSVQVTQFKLVLLEKGLDSAAGSLAISLYALGVLVGRFLCGVALDHFPTHVVAAIWLGLPGIGHLLLASHFATPPVLIVAVLLVGLSMGAEGDLFAYLAMKYFPLEVFSTMVGIFIGTTALAGASGSVLLSFMLKQNGSYAPFLVLCGICAFLGAGVLMMLSRVTTVSRMAQSPA